MERGKEKEWGGYMREREKEEEGKRHQCKGLRMRK